LIYATTRRSSIPTAPIFSTLVLPASTRPEWRTSLRPLSLGSLLVSLASLVVAFKTKQEVKAAARLESRIKAINHILDALHDLTKDGIVRATTTASIGKALNRSGALLFTRTVREEIDRAHATAFRLQNVQITDRNAQEIVALRKDLQTLMARMNQDATLLG
jgi:hypothetical protein